MTIKEFQKLISEKYEHRDRERGTPKTFLWFIEEIGELATALANDDHENKIEEFGDVLAWLATLANINDVDLEQAIQKYKKGHLGYKWYLLYQTVTIHEQIGDRYLFYP